MGGSDSKSACAVPGNPGKPVAFASHSFFSHRDGFAGLWHMGGGRYVLAVKGTDCAMNLAQDMTALVQTFSGGVLVHKGFKMVFDQLKGPIYAALHQMPQRPTEVICTGHSMGAAVAQLFALDLAISHGYNVSCAVIAPPRVGTKAFADLLRQRVPGLFLVAMYGDLIPTQPACGLTPGFQHAKRLLTVETTGPFNMMSVLSFQEHGRTIYWQALQAALAGERRVYYMDWDQPDGAAARPPLAPSAGVQRQQQNPWDDRTEYQRDGTVTKNSIRPRDAAQDYVVHFTFPGRASLDNVQCSCPVKAGIEAVIHRKGHFGTEFETTASGSHLAIFKGGFPNGGECFADIHAPWGTLLPTKEHRGPFSRGGNIILEIRPARAGGSAGAACGDATAAWDDDAAELGHFALSHIGQVAVQHILDLQKYIDAAYEPCLPDAADASAEPTDTNSAEPAQTNKQDL